MQMTREDFDHEARGLLSVNKGYFDIVELRHKYTILSLVTFSFRR
jgi:hypothetical protein